MDYFKLNRVYVTAQRALFANNRNTLCVYRWMYFRFTLMKYGGMYLCFSSVVLSAILQSNCKEINIDFRLAKKATASSEVFHTSFVIFKSEICVYGKTDFYTGVIDENMHFLNNLKIIPIIKRNASSTHFVQDSLLTHNLMHLTQNNG